MGIVTRKPRGRTGRSRCAKPRRGPLAACPGTCPGNLKMAERFRQGFAVRWGLVS
jgi:hypothetical protein